MPATIGVLKETVRGENRVAIVPEVATRLAALGARLLVERGAGSAARFPDAQYKDVTFADGADAVLADADLLFTVQPPDAAAIVRLRPGAVVAGFLAPHAQAALVRALKEKRITSFAMELVPRISRAQSMDALSSQAAVAGYKAVLLAASALDKFYPMLTTAAGTIRPATVLVIGAGVAGLQAIATARRLGAVVEAYDIRSDTREQVESLGARFVEFDLGTGDMQDERGYAKELTDDQKQRQSVLMAAQIQSADVVITTAQVPGRRAPLLIPADVVGGMKPGSVIVDMAAESGGNCALSRAGEVVVEHGVKIIGPRNLPGSVCATTSQLYASNLVAFLGALLKEGQVALDLEDEVLRAPLVCHQGEVTNERVQEALAR